MPRAKRRSPGRSVRAPASRWPGAGLAQVAAAALVGGLLVSLGALRLGHLRTLETREATAAVWVDPADSVALEAPSWVDPRWLDHLQALLDAEEPFAVADPERLEPLRETLAALSFVERVERCALGLDGLRLDLVLRRPVACVPVRGEFALVDREGVVLEGRWPVPPRLGEAILPVLGQDDPLLDEARAGDWLAEPEHRDALDVALSMEQHLSERTRGALGRVRIDARRSREASVTEPGVRLELEGGREAFFGRSPGAGEPGELAADAKWEALERALALFANDPERNDWDLVDLRWDRPDLRLRSESRVARVDPEAPRATPSRRERRETDPSRPRVR